MNNNINTTTAVTNSKHSRVSAISFKIAFQGELRRLPYLPFHNELGFQTLKARLENLFDIEGPFTLTYKDEDDDTITIGSEEEFQLACTPAGGLSNNLLRLTITQNGTKAIEQQTNEQQTVPLAIAQNRPLAQNRAEMKGKISAVKLAFRSKLSELKEEFPSPAQRTAEQKESFQEKRKLLVDERDQAIREIRSEFKDTIANPAKQIKVDFRLKLAELKKVFAQDGNFHPRKLDEETKQAFFDARTALINERDAKLREVRESKEDATQDESEVGNRAYFNPGRGRRQGRHHGHGNGHGHGRGFGRRHWRGREENPTDDMDLEDDSSSSDSDEENSNFHDKPWRHHRHFGRGRGRGRRWADPAFREQWLLRKRSRLQAKLDHLDQMAAEQD